MEIKSFPHHCILDKIPENWYDLKNENVQSLALIDAFHFKSLKICSNAIICNPSSALPSNYLHGAKTCHLLNRFISPHVQVYLSNVSNPSIDALISAFEAIPAHVDIISMSISSSVSSQPMNALCASKCDFLFHPYSPSYPYPNTVNSISISKFKSDLSSSIISTLSDDLPISWHIPVISALQTRFDLFSSSKNQLNLSNLLN